MKKLTLALFTVFSLTVFAQEKPFITDAVLSIDKRNDIPDAKNQIEEAGKAIASKGGAIDPKLMNKYLYYNGLINYKIATSDKPEILALDPNALEIAADSWIQLVEFEAKNNLKRYTPDAQMYLPNVAIEFARRGYGKNDAEDFLGSKEDLLKSFELRKNPALGQAALVDTSTLYNAALISGYGKDYKAAAAIATQVLEMGYNGYTFTATEAVGDKLKVYSNKEKMEHEVAIGIARDPQYGPSVRPDIYIFLIRVYQSDEDMESFQAILAKARKEFPSNKDFINYEINVHLKNGDFEKALSILDEAIAVDPTNVIYYDVKGSVYLEMKENDKAFEYYSKALALDPNYFDSNYSIGFIHYNRGRAVIDQMNQLGMSTADQKKYDQLKKVKEEHFRTSLPFFEKCHELKPTDELSIKALWEVYRQIGQPEKSLKMKELLDSLGTL